MKRRVPDSNGCTRLCRPLPNHSANAPCSYLSARNRVRVVCRSGLHPFTAVIGVRWFTRTPSRSSCTPVVSVPSTGRVNTPPPGLSRLPGGSDSPCRSHRRGRSRAHLPALVVGSSAVAQGSCLVGCGRGLRDRPESAELAVPRRGVPGRHRFLLRDVGYVEGSRSRRPQVRGCGSGAGVRAGRGCSVGVGSVRPVGLFVASVGVGAQVSV